MVRLFCQKPRAARAELCLLSLLVSMCSASLIRAECRLEEAKSPECHTLIGQRSSAQQRKLSAGSNATDKLAIVCYHWQVSSSDRESVSV